MLTRPSAHLDEALARLSPYERALLELSLRRGVSDDEIAGLLRIEPEEVERRRADALARLADDLDAGSSGDLTDVLTESWGNGDAPSGNGAPAMTNDAPVATAAPAPSRRRPHPALLAALVAAAAVAVFLVLSGGSTQKAPHPAAPARPAAPATVGAGSAQLRPVGPAIGVRGTARLRGDRLRLAVKGLPPADYTVWLYNSIADATPLGNLHDGRLDARIPGNLARYRFLDVSREPRDGNPNHSGASVLRAPLSSLKR